MAYATQYEFQVGGTDNEICHQSRSVPTVLALENLDETRDKGGEGHEQVEEVETRPTTAVACRLQDGLLGVRAVVGRQRAQVHEEASPCTAPITAMVTTAPAGRSYS